MRADEYNADLVVVGGGLAGTCAAISAARQGLAVALIQNRPVLGGNSSSEVRVWVCGATAHQNQRLARENGIIGELLLENQFRNPEGNPVYWDDVVLDAVRAEPNIRLFLNTDVREIEATGPDDARMVASVTGWTMGSEITTTFRAPLFADCTGDGLIGHLAGARYRLGKESKAEFGEEWAGDEPVREFLGSTLLFYTKDLGRPVKFVAPDSAIDITRTPIPTNRIIRSGDNGAHYWWVEWGGELDIVSDNERIRDELRGVILGIWDYIKNSGEFDAKTLTLEWVGNVPGKREYRRMIGDYTLTQQDVIEQRQFPDAIAFGGWPIDLHPSGGMYAEKAGALQRFGHGVFTIPLRCLYSVNVDNLFLAGRNISATHIAFGATRVMATCSLLGEAVGVAAAVALARDTTPRQVAQQHYTEVQQRLLWADGAVLGVPATDQTDAAIAADITASSTRSDVSTGPETGWWDLDRAAALVLPVGERLDSITFRIDAAEPEQGSSPTTGPTAGRTRALIPGPTTVPVTVYTSDRPQNTVPIHRELGVTATVADGHARADLSWTPPNPDPVTGVQNAIVVVGPQPGLRLALADRPVGTLGLVEGPHGDDQNVDVSTESALLRWPTRPVAGQCPAFSAEVDTRPYAPDRVAGEYQRPWNGPNLWASGPLGADAQWLQLEWPEPIRVGRLTVIFDDDVEIELNTLHHHRTPDEVMTTLVRDFSVEVRESGQWRQLAAVSDNRRRRWTHPVDSSVTAVRVSVTATNGCPEARIVAIRCESI